MFEHKDNSFFSIITVTFNAAEFIEKTLVNIFNQKFSNYQLIVVDGASRDETLNIINKYKDKIDIVISEPDCGIYDAMNKGVKMATGDYIVFMNAGDFFFNELTLKNIHEQISVLKFKPDVVYGRHSVLTKTGIKDGLKPSFSKQPKYMPFCHQSVYARRELLNKYKFNLSYKIVADYDFILNCIKNGHSFYNYNSSLSIVSPGGLSDSSRIMVIKQYSDVYKTHFDPTFLTRIHWCFSIIKETLKFLIKRVLASFGCGH